ncbi:ead/Ea22-like family protein [Escherichia coli]|uniref:ead/Ea22-like family protein n=1 Tax=Escherichia coli TaxID=562 RepID=UPI00092D4CB6|nr:ead/Ea22-like family protein [Escherichia coli]HBA6774849.1 ead/Ea22-like family protein [Escherichia coli]HBA6894874.1 ead/Ea22-like family protein [Escherichia coli]HBA7229530.1 ead/Ea22-like family protein [Escherichia coli]HBA9156736.1 ead/Ea22-like family protein [Escherichia coli]
MSEINYRALRERYAPKPVPKCRICGDEMTVQRICGSRITYGCTGATYDDKGRYYAEGRSIADDHYEQSRVTVIDVSDPEVLALLDEREAQSKRIAELETNLAALAVENAGIKSAIPQLRDIDADNDNMDDVSLAEDFGFNHAIERMRRQIPETPATDAFLAEVKTEARKEGAYFVANRMLAAWEAGFIDDTAKNAADIARMILTSTEFMANAPEGDFDRSFSDGVLEDIAAQLRKGGKQ